MHAVMKRIQRLHVHKKDWKLTCSAEEMRERLVGFAKNAQAILRKQNKLRDQAQAKKFELFNHNERARLVCILADQREPLQNDINLMLQKESRGWLQVAGSPAFSEGPKNFSTVVVPRWQSPSYVAPVPSCLATAGEQSVLYGIDPNADIQFNRSVSFLKSQCDALRHKYGVCRSNYAARWNRGEPDFWPFCQSDPIMLLLHRLASHTFTISMFLSRLSVGGLQRSNYKRKRDDSENNPLAAIEVQHARILQVKTEIEVENGRIQQRLLLEQEAAAKETTKAKKISNLRNYLRLLTELDKSSASIPEQVSQKVMDLADLLKP